MKSNDVILVKGDATEEKAKSTLFVILVIIGAVAAIAGIVLNIILPGNDYEFGVNTSGDENRGIHA